MKVGYDSFVQSALVKEESGSPIGDNRIGKKVAILVKVDRLGSGGVGRSGKVVACSYAVAFNPVYGLDVREVHNHTHEVYGVAGYAAAPAAEAVVTKGHAGTMVVMDGA